MEKSENGSGADLIGGSRAKPFEIDLNETPVCSPRELVVVANDTTTVRRVGLLDINAMPPSEEESTPFESFRFPSNYHSLDPQSRSKGFPFMRRGFDLNQIKEDSLMFSQVKHYKECPQGGFGFKEMQASNRLKSNLRVTPENIEENGSCDPLQVGLPVQFEDFCILAVGEVDPRPSYHGTNQIWPVGYRCSWHDKITGSLFACEVTDGGEHGPLFKIKRYPCSAQLIPVGSTVLLPPNLSFEDGRCKIDSGDTVFQDDDECTSIHMLFSDDSPPNLEYNELSNCRNNFDEAPLSEPYKRLEIRSNYSSLNGRSTATHKEPEDHIGEFLVEARSSSSVWGMVSRTLVHACRKAYEQTGVCKFSCKHEQLRRWSSCFVSINEEATEDLDSLEKFCSMSGPVNIPHMIRNDDELNASCKALLKWLEWDRFGLDVDFVQEIIERHPHVNLCKEYTSLNKRSEKSISKTVGSGFFRVARKGHLHEKGTDISTLRGCQRPTEHVIENPVMKTYCFPGKPLSSKLPTELIGDVLQSWELLWRFSEVLGLEEPLSFKELEEELIYGHSSTLENSYSTVSKDNGNACVDMGNESLSEAACAKQVSQTNSQRCGVALVTVLCSLLKILLGELQSKIAAFVDSNFDGGETKSRRRRKKDSDNSFSAQKVMLDLIPINGLTWPELARRYVLTVSSLEGNLDVGDLMNSETGKAFHYLQGDGRTIHGSLPGVAGMEADALLLAEATKQIFGALKSKNDIASVDYYEADATVSHRMGKLNENGIPEWALVLEPVRKLPTNVGARIRKCVYEALDRHPPEWARRRLEHSISKEVYKGNASGPTKKAVLSVLADISGEPQLQKPVRKKKNRSFSSVSDVIIRQCRKVLRAAVAADEDKVFCNLLGRTLLNTSENDDEGLIGFPAMVSRPLDFRTIDLRLAYGAYGGSHEAFIEDVREVWHHIRTAFGDQSDLLQLAEELSKEVEVLYEKEVLSLVQKFSNYPNLDSLDSEAKKELEDIFESASEIPKAPWDEGVCKVCGVDKDDDNVLLCDTCDSGYHTYCLTPPLAGVPEGNWYCPSCVAGRSLDQYTLQHPHVISRGRKRRVHSEFSHGVLESLFSLATTMETRDYWEYTARERILLLKFLCDELLTSADVREHLEQCASISVDLQQKLRSLYAEWRILKFKEESMACKVARVNSKCGPDDMASVRTSKCKPTRQLHRGSSPFSSLPNGLILPEDHQHSDSRKQSNWVHLKGDSMKHSCVSGNQLGGILDTDFQLHLRYAKDRTSRISDSPNQLFVSAAQILKHNCAGESSDLKREQELPEVGINGSVLPSFEVSLNHMPSDNIKSPAADHLCAKDVHCEKQLPDQRSIAQPDMNEPQSNDIRGELKNLQDSIACIESQLAAVSLRKESLGRDCAGRVYWSFSRPGISSWLVVDGTMMSLEDGNITVKHGNLLDNNSTSNYSQFKIENKGIPTSPSWFSLQSDAEIEELVEWLTDSDAKERELAETLLRWRRIGNKDSNKACNFVVQDETAPGPSDHIGTTVNTYGVRTNALAVLEKKYGPCMEMEAFNIAMTQSVSAESSRPERMYRCECLELVWPSRCHCHRCHRSFLSRHELMEHTDGICNFGPSPPQISRGDSGKENGMTMVEKLMVGCVFRRGKQEQGTQLSEIFKESAPPYDIREISAKFVTESSVKELVQEIGLIGSNGVPSFVPSTSSYLSDPALRLVSLCRGDGNESSELENHLKSPVQENNSSCMKHDSLSHDLVRRCMVGGNDEEVVKIRRTNPNVIYEKRDLSLKFRSTKLGIGKDSSLRPLKGKSMHILKQLKTNLLDMDAAVTEEALRSSKASTDNRCAWRAFVKSAKSITQMVQATIVFEDMIKTQFLRNGWWYWSSLSAAANISTVSSLALRLHTLDAAIIYEKPSTTSASAEIPELVSKSDTETPPCKDSADTSKQKTKSGKRKREL